MIKYRWSVSGGIILGSESVYEQYHRRVDQITTLCNALESLVEKLELIPLAPGVSAAPDPSDQATADSVWSLIHEKVRVVARGRFDDGHYADAVEAALKALGNEVKNIAKSRGAPDMDGATLMHTVFSPKNPLIVLADLSTQTGKDMQQGYMELFAGAMSAVRNPKAHDNVTIDPERALHFLVLASTLWHTLDARL